jgi:hypothetical protein
LNGIILVLILLILRLNVNYTKRITSTFIKLKLNQDFYSSDNNDDGYKNK